MLIYKGLYLQGKIFTREIIYSRKRNLQLQFVFEGDSTGYLQIKIVARKPDKSILWHLWHTAWIDLSISRNKQLQSIYKN
tara:strand:+ start:193 stop:432 length:240 start_codon:yes stop_codon:yes gene_type:complete